MDEAKRIGIETSSAAGGGVELLTPPDVIHWSLAALEESKADLRRGSIERLSDEPSSWIVHGDETRLPRLIENFTSIDPGMTPHPALGAACGHSNHGHARSGRRTVAPRR